MTINNTLQPISLHAHKEKMDAVRNLSIDSVNALGIKKIGFTIEPGNLSSTECILKTFSKRKLTFFLTLTDEKGISLSAEKISEKLLKEAGELAISSAKSAALQAGKVLNSKCMMAYRNEIPFPQTVYFKLSAAQKKNPVAIPLKEFILNPDASKLALIQSLQ